jgi:putative NIF3 family GTP cyclohydrolase 1 type 2
MAEEANSLAACQKISSCLARMLGVNITSLEATRICSDCQALQVASIAKAPTENRQRADKTKTKIMTKKSRNKVQRSVGARPNFENFCPRHKVAWHHPGDAAVGGGPHWRRAALVSACVGAELGGPEGGSSQQGKEALPRLLSVSIIYLK